MHFLLALFISLGHAASNKTPKPTPNQPPQWSVSTLDLGTAHRSEPFQASLPGGAATDPDGDPLTFQIVKGSGPGWLKVTKDGKFSGTPGAKDKGKQTWKVQAKDNKLAAAIRVEITLQNRAPVWTSPSLDVGELIEERKFTHAFSDKASDADRDKLTFRKVEGPEWLSVDAKGRASGTPPEGTFGDLKAVIEAHDGEALATTTLQGKILQKNYPPQIAKIEDARVKERETLDWDLRKWVQDRNTKDTLRFTLHNQGAWLSLTADGHFQARPAFAQIGQHTIAFSVTDGQHTAKGSFSLTVLRNPRPPVWSPIATFQTKSREPFKADIAKQASDADGVPLTFSKVKGPAWLTVSAKGELSGTPTDEDARDSEITIKAANDVASADQTFHLMVTRKNYPPVVSRPVVLTVKERETTTTDLRDGGFVQDKDGDKLLFQADKLPPFAKLEAQGRLTLAPLYAHIGKHAFPLTVKDAEAGVELPVTVTVERNPRAPEWVKEDIRFHFETREPFTASVADKVKDLDGKTVKITLLEGPAWLGLTPAGALSAKPTDEQAGRFDLLLQADNGERKAQKTIRLDITIKNRPPVVHAAAWTFACKERETCEWDLSGKKYVTDPDGDKLSFTLVKKPDWITLSPQGEFSVKPAFAHIGTHSLSVEIQDRELKIPAKLDITVARDPRPPVWTMQTLDYKTKAREPFKTSIANAAKDLDGLALQFRKVEGPAWLTVAPDGTITGNPQDSDIGKHSVVFAVANDKLSAERPARIEVLFKNKPPTWTQTKVTLGELRAGDALSANLSAFATDPDPGDKLTFEKVQGPAWVMVSPNGQVIGRPGRKDVGEAVVKVRVLDPSREPAEAAAVVKVTPPPNAPALAKGGKALKLPEAFQGELFAYRLSDFFGHDPSQRYKLVSGPSWLVLRPTGEFSGIPPEAGPFEIVVEVTNGQQTREFKGSGKVSPP